MADEDQRPDLRTPDGTDLRIAVSALIKALRRGQEVEAYYWAKQIENGGFWRYLWRRLRIFASEDVSLADNQAAVLIDSLASSYSVLAAERRNKWQAVDRSLIAHAVLYLARCSKSREADDFLNAAECVQGWGWMPTIGPEVHDLHTPTGKEQMSRFERMLHWYQQASVIRNRTGDLDWRLWGLRWAAWRGFFTREFVEQVAARWQAEGRLRYGLDGYEAARFEWTTPDPEWPDEEPQEPDPDGEVWS